jgi:hypothetical protein
MTESRRPDPGKIDEPIDELLGAYALDAIDDAERAQIEQYLITSSAGRLEVDRMTDAIDQVVEAQADTAGESVGETVGEPGLPAGLWDRIADQLPPRLERVPELAAPFAAVDELVDRRSHRNGRTARIVLSVAAAVLVVALGVGVVRRTSTSSTTSVAQQLELQADRAAGQSGSHTATLTGPDGAVSVRVVIDDQGRGYVLPTGLPALGSDRTYQLWSIDGGTPISLGLLGSDPTVAVVGTGGSPSQLAITAEPASGSTGPTSNPVAVGTIA